MVRKRKESVDDLPEVVNGRKMARQRAAAVNKSVQLPRINTDSEADFIKMFVEKNNRPFKQPSQKKLRQVLSGSTQKQPKNSSSEKLPKGPQAPPPQDYIDNSYKQNYNEIRAKFLQDSIAQQQQQIKSMTEIQNKILRAKMRQGIDKRTIQELQKIEIANKMQYQQAQQQFLTTTSGDEF